MQFFEEILVTRPAATEAVLNTDRKASNAQYITALAARRDMLTPKGIATKRPIMVINLEFLHLFCHSQCRRNISSIHQIFNMSCPGISSPYTTVCCMFHSLSSCRIRNVSSPRVNTASFAPRHLEYKDAIRPIGAIEAVTFMRFVIVIAVCSWLPGSSATTGCIVSCQKCYRVPLFRRDRYLSF